MQGKYQITNFQDQIKSLNLTTDLKTKQKIKKEKIHLPIMQKDIRQVSFIPFQDEIAWRSKNLWRLPLESL
jgi:hypothetical protein